MTSAFSDPSSNSDDPFAKIKEEKSNLTPDPRSVNLFHARSDVDSSPSAQHHTLGISHNQASPGDHIHDGRNSKLIGEGLSLTISGSRGGNAAVASIITMLQKVIDFTDNTTA